MTWPFRFYGAQPAEWYGGGRLDYELQFVRAPTPHERAAIARAVATADRGFQAVRLDGHDRWTWADRWTWLIVRTRAMEPDWDVFFQEVGALFRAVHAEWPLEQAVCRSVDPSPQIPDDEWTAWSRAQQAEIGARPRWREDLPAIARDRYAPSGPVLPAIVSVDNDFERVRRP